MAFVLLAIPLLFTYSNSGIGAVESIRLTINGMMVAMVLQLLSIFYKKLIIELLPKRQPSSKNAESFFIAISAILFHYLFYVITPIVFYSIDLSIEHKDNMHIKS
jgi:hypothetical protein